MENAHAATIEDSRAPRDATSETANREPVDAPQATALTSVPNLATADPASPEPAVVPASIFVADVPKADLAELTVAPAAMSVGEAATADPDPPETASVLAGFSAAEAPVLEAPLRDSRPTPPPETRVQLASLFMLKDGEGVPETSRAPG